ncbi:hypothetical protein BJY00DRAFT_280743 [Aspergillus carlsbadensis]|nr:hypothetical protein BJY00DRAFT_280743 [Aspergillus carlsbadensis]
MTPMARMIKSSKKATKAERKTLGAPADWPSQHHIQIKAATDKISLAICNGAGVLDDPILWSTMTGQSRPRYLAYPCACRRHALPSFHPIFPLFLRNFAGPSWGAGLEGCVVEGPLSSYMRTLQALRGSDDAVASGFRWGCDRLAWQSVKSFLLT